MKITQETINILKNFATIEKGILIKPGNVIRTRTEAIYAEATVAEEFPLEIGIYDLSNLLNAITLFSDPEFEFEPAALRITESDPNADRAEVVYGYAGDSLVTLKMNRKPIQIPDQHITFSLPEDAWSKLQKAVGVFQKPELKIQSDGKIVRIGTENHKQQQGHSYSLEVSADPSGYECSMVFDYKNLKLLKGAYTGKVTPLFTQFQHTALNLMYLIGPEPTCSTFDGE